MLICLPRAYRRDTKLDDSYFNRDVEKAFMAASRSLFEEKTRPSTLISNQVGNMYTSSVYGGLASYLAALVPQADDELDLEPANGYPLSLFILARRTLYKYIVYVCTHARSIFMNISLIYIFIYMCILLVDFRCD